MVAGYNVGVCYDGFPGYFLGQIQGPRTAYPDQTAGGHPDGNQTGFISTLGRRVLFNLQKMGKQLESLEKKGLQDARCAIIIAYPILRGQSKIKKLLINTSTYKSAFLGYIKKLIKSTTYGIALFLISLLFLGVFPFSKRYLHVVRGTIWQLEAR